MIRPVRPYEVAQVQRLLNSKGYEWLDIRDGICMVWEKEGRIAGVLPARLIWEVEPLILLEENGTAMFRLVQAVEDWIHSPQNTTGVRRMYAHVSDEVAEWGKRTGWFEAYARMRHLVKYLPKL